MPRPRDKQRWRRRSKRPEELHRSDRRSWLPYSRGRGQWCGFERRFVRPYRLADRVGLSGNGEARLEPDRYRPEANYENPADAKNANACPDPDAMITKGTVDYKDGAYTITGSGEGFIHGWDQGNLVYFKTKVQGDFTFTAKVDRFEMTNGKPLNGAAEALLNVREDLNYRQPTQSVIAGSPPSKFIFMARYYWDGDPNNKWWHWPAWPTTSADPRPLLSWTRITRRGSAFAAYSSTDGQTWDVIKHNDTDKSHPDWYPFQLDKMPAAVYVGLVCSARNNRNYAPMTKLPGKSADCRDPNSELLRSSARCVFVTFRLPSPEIAKGW